MQSFIQFMKIFIAEISVETLLIYDFLCVCRIINKEEVVEKIWKKIFPQKIYNEAIVFILIRPMFLQISFLTYLLSKSILIEIAIYRMMLFFAPILAMIVFVSNMKKN